MQRKLIYFSLLFVISVSITGCSFDKRQSDSPTNSYKSNDSSSDSTITNDYNSTVTVDNSNKDIDSDKNNLNKGTKNKIDASNLDNTSINWFFKPNTENKTPEVNNSLSFDLADYDAIYAGPIKEDSKSLYLTFDEGYENGYTSKILDVLKEKDVKAVFFVTLPYMNSHPDLIKRMVDEGHIVGNHSKNHPAMPDKTSMEDSFNLEFTEVEEKYKELTDKEMIKLFRPPMGTYSEKSLAMTKNLGYKSVFWSFAYQDWDPEKQPDPIEAKEKIITHLHDGSVLLLHAVSETNTNILGSVIDEARKLGYEFELLK